MIMTRQADNAMSRCPGFAVLLASLLVLSASACSDRLDPAKGGGGSAADASQQKGGQDLPSVETKMVYEFEEWYEDFPYPLHVPPRRPGTWYGRNSQEALEKVIANLSGLCSKPAWLLSKQFFDRHWDVSKELLVEVLDAAQRRRDQYDLAENIVNVMGRCEDGAFAEVLVRAAVHSHPGIRNAAFRALRHGGDEAAILKIGKSLTRMSQVEQIEWVKAATVKLSDEKLFPILREMLVRQEYAHLQNHAFEAAMNLPAERVLKLVEPFRTELAADLQLYIAGLMHSIGDARGTARLKVALKPPIKILKRKFVAVRGTILGDASPMVDELLELTNEDHENLNVLLIEALRNVPGDNVSDALITMTDTAKPFLVRQAALRALAHRGVNSEFEGLMETLRTSPKNSKFRDAVADLVAAKYGKAAPVLLERSKEGTVKEQVFYVRMIGSIGTHESFLAFKEIFLRSEYRFTGWRERHSNVTFLGVHFSNLGKSVDEMLALFGELTREDYRRRAALIHALANIAGTDPLAEASQRIYSAFRVVVFDAKEVPQLRILALDYLRRDIGIGDAMKLKARLPKASKGLRRYFSDYLLEFF